MAETSLLVGLGVLLLAGLAAVIALLLRPRAPVADPAAEQRLVAPNSRLDGMANWLQNAHGQLQQIMQSSQRQFQQTVNELHFLKPLKVDCKIGSKTVLAYRDLQDHYGKVDACVRTLDRLDAKQRAEYDRLVRVNPKLRAFYKGWIAHRIGNIDRKTCGRGI